MQESSDAFQNKTHTHQVSLSKRKCHRKNIGLEYVDTKEQIADIFTKPLPREAFEYLREKLGVISSPKDQV